MHKPAAEAEARLSPVKAAYRELMKDLPIVPSLVLCMAYVGYGVLCQSVSMGLFASLITTMFIYALPAQVVLVDEIGRHATLIGAFIAVSFTAVRLLPMTVALLPYFRSEGEAETTLQGPNLKPKEWDIASWRGHSQSSEATAARVQPQKPKSKWLQIAAAHFVAVTLWIESMRRIPHLSPELRYPYYFIMAAMMIGVSIVGTTLGYFAAQYLSQNMAAALIFLTPIYFTVGLLRNARIRADYTPIFLGFIAAPLFMAVNSGFDLVLAGLVGGSLNFFVVRRIWRAKPAVKMEQSS